MYILKTHDGLSLTLKEEEAQKVLEAINEGTQKSIIVQNNYFAISNISSLTKEEVSEGKKIDREKQMIGVTPSGETVEKRYGVWYYQKSYNDYQYDDEGRCTLRYEGHPILPTPTEYETLFKDIPDEEWLPKLIEQSEGGREIKDERRLSSGSEAIGTLLPKADLYDKKDNV